MKPIKLTRPNLLLVDDDKDDCLFFKEALESLPVTASLITVNDGEQLMEMLGKIAVKHTARHIVFLDLNMPRKNGFEVLTEIMLDEKLKRLPIIIFSTSFEHDIVNMSYKKGAHYYIRKPTDFSILKKVIYQALMLATVENVIQPEKENFVLNGDLGGIQL
jgi:CheY-like chemotaxis protein